MRSISHTSLMKAISLSRSGRSVSACLHLYRSLHKVRKDVIRASQAVAEQAGLSPWTSISRPLLEIGVAVVLSHATHFLTIIMLYRLSQLLLRNQSTTSLLAAIIHIVSPAGAFLSAPYSESLFSCLNFLGFYLYVDTRNGTSLYQNLETVIAGLVFGCATIVRSNGIFSGLPFLYDAALQLVDLLRNGSSAKKVSALSALIGGGCLIAVGAACPQYLAYREYCTNPVQHERRPWCDFTFPSIYAWVQQHYWSVHTTFCLLMIC